MEIRAINPTVLLVREGDALAQVVDLTLHQDGAAADAVLALDWDGGHLRRPLGAVQPGETRHRLSVPEFTEPTVVRVSLASGGAVQAEQCLTWTPPRHWDVHLVHISHHDWGYTDLPSSLWLEQDRILDEALAYCSETDGFPEEARFRYTVEQGWSLLHFLESHPERTDEVIRRIKEGRIEVTALYANTTTELCGHEELVRLLYPTFALRRRYGIPIRSALHNDIPGMAWGLSLVLTGAGVEYFAPGLPTYFSWGGQEVHDFWDEQALFPHGEPGFFHWQAPDGARLLTWYSKMWHAVLDSPEGLHRLVPYLARLETQTYPLTSVRVGVNGGGRDNAHPSLRYALLARAWNRTYAWPRLIMSTNTTFFDAARAQLGDSVPIFAGDLPNTDYTVGATSTALETGIIRMAHDHLGVAERFATLATQVTGCPYPREHLERAYRAMLLFDDHTWGFHSIIGPAQSGNLAEKKVEAYRAAALAHDVVSKSLNRLADELELPDEGYYVAVFNPLNWTRTDVVCHQALQDRPVGSPLNWVRGEGETDPAPSPLLRSGGAIGRGLIDLPAELLDGPLAVVDVQTGTIMPHQIVALTSPDLPRPDAARRYAYGHVAPTARHELRFLAADVPALGYRTFAVVRQPGPPREPGVIVEATSLENQFYRIELDPRTGTIARLYDKELGTELIDQAAPHRFNELVARHPHTGQEERQGEVTISKGLHGSLCGSLLVQGRAAGCPLLTQEITLYADVKRIDIANRLLRDASPLWEISFAFPFAIAAPRFRYEGVNSVMEPLADQLPGTNSHAHVVQHWATISNDQVGVTWSSREAPVVLFGGLWPGYVSQAHHAVAPAGFGAPFLTPGELRHGHLYSLVMSNNFRTNFQAVQVADVTFRYSLTSHVGDGGARQGRDFGWGHGSPLETVCVRGPQARSLPPQGQFCRVEGDTALLLTMKQAENGRGIIVRLIETAGVAGEARVHVPYFDIAYAVETTLVEEDQGMLDAGRHSVCVPLRPHGISTVRLVPATPILPG